MNLSARLAALLPALVVSAVGATSANAAGTISTTAGTGVEGSSGDNGSAVLARLKHPKDVAPLPDGGYLVADTENRVVRRVSATGVITRVAGTGVKATSTDGVLATSAGLQSPNSVSPTADGGFLITDRLDDRVRRVSPSGIISTVAGTGSLAGGGSDDDDDDGSPSGSELYRPRDAVELTDGSVLIADTGNNRIIRVAPGGVRTTVAGTGSDGFSGDGGPAASAKLKKPTDVSPTAGGGFLLVDSSNDRIRRVSPDGTISTVAGGAASGAPLGDGGQATSALLSDPIGVAVLPDGGYLIADRGAERIRRVAPDGVITTDAGTGVAGAAGDGGPSTSAQLKDPYDVGVSAGGYYIADEGNHKVRFVAYPVAPVAPVAPVTPPAVDAPVAPPAADSPVTPGAPDIGQPPATTKPEPQIGRTVVLAATKGRVLVRAPGRGQGFVALSGADDVPVGSVIDTRKGTVALSSALANGKTQTGTFNGGLFKVAQSKKERGMTRLTLTGKLSCSPTASASSTTASASRRGSRRRLWGRDRRGRFGTNGRNSAATVRGTQWLTEDRCNGTLTRVVKGAVEVYDKVAKKRVLVRAGKSYLARSPR